MATRLGALVDAGWHCDTGDMCSQRESAKKMETFFDKHGNEAVFISRFITGLRQFNGIIAGIGNMKWSKFVLFNFLGAVLWVLFWSSIAYFLGDQSEILFETFKQYSFVGLVFIALIVYYQIKRKSNRAES